MEVKMNHYKRLFVIALLLCLPTTVWAVTLQEALKNGQVGGELKYMFVDASDTSVDAAKGIDDKTSQAVSIHLNYVSADFYGFKAGVSFEHSHDLTSDSDTPDLRLAFSKTKLSQSYLQYSFHKSDVKVGRQYLYTPLLKNTKGWALYDSFSGIVVTSKEIPDTVISAIYIKDWNTSWSNIPEVHYEDPIYSLYGMNKSVQGLVLTGQYMMTNQEGNNGDIPAKTLDGYDIFFAQGDYSLPISFPVTVSLQYGGAKFDNQAEEDTNYYGIKLATKVAGIKLESAYTSVADDNDFPGTLGHACNEAMFNHMLINTSLFAGLESWSVKAGYDFAKFGVNGLKSSLMYTTFKQSTEGMVDGKSARDMDGAYEVDLDVKYAFSGALKGLGFRVYAGYADYDLSVPADSGDTDGNTDDVKYVRCFVNYKF